jgi:hypothetical protein
VVEVRPSHGDVLAELRRVREAGLPRLRTLQLPILGTLARQVLGDDSLEPPVAVEQLLRCAVEKLGGGSYGDAAAYAFGLETGTRGFGPRKRQEGAADSLEMSAETFRTRHQTPLVSDVADQMLALLAEHKLREARREMERRHPAESRLAVQWVERFEAYYRIWTPAYALGADLTAFRSTLLEEDRLYDGAEEPGPGGEPYTQEGQADGYAQYALYRYAEFEWELRQFMTRHGGMWLLSDDSAETAVVDAVYRVSWHVTPFNERDRSFLRGVLQDVRDREMHGFLQNLARSDIGRATYIEWMDWLKDCACRWSEPSVPDPEHFRTHRHQAGIARECQVHRVIEACGDYCDLIDQEWRKIADWYHLDQPICRGRSSEELYAEWRSHRPRRGTPEESPTSE